MNRASQAYQTRAKPDRYRASSPSAKRSPATRKDGGIPQKIYVPYRALAMLAFTYAIVLAMLALLKENSSPLTDVEKLAASTQTTSPASAEKDTSTSDSAAKAEKQVNVHICVFNAGKKVGYGARIVTALKGADFAIEGEAQNFDHPPTNRTTIFYPAEHRAEAMKINEIVKEAQLLPRPDSLVVCPHNIVVLLF